MADKGDSREGHGLQDNEDVKGNLTLVELEENRMEYM